MNVKYSLSKIKIPHVFIFFSWIILFASFLTYFVPSGLYEREIKELGMHSQTVVVPGSYHEVPKHYSIKGLLLGEQIEGKASPTSLLGLFSSIPKGMNQAAALIFFVFTIGAVFNLIQRTGTIRVLMSALIHKFRNRRILLFFGIYMALSAASSFMGMAVEFIPLIALFLLIAKEFGYDQMFGIGLMLIPLFVGWTSAITNPFTVQIAQVIAEVPIGSGMLLRVILFIISLIIGFSFLMWYGRKVRLSPNKSLMAGQDFELDEELTMKREPILKKHILILVSAVILFSLILYAVQTMGWGLIEMSGGFFAVGVITILISGMSGDESMDAFVKGLETMIIPALIVGFARGIQVVLQEGLIIDTMLYHTSDLLSLLPRGLAVQGMFVFQAILNFFIPSASGQALVTMPLMTPLADLLGVSRQTAVLAFILGDGYTNIIIPTNGVLMAYLSIAGVPFEKWFKFILPLFLLLLVLAFVLLYVAIVIGY